MSRDLESISSSAFSITDAGSAISNVHTALGQENRQPNTSDGNTNGPLKQSLFRPGDGDIILEVDGLQLETHKYILRKFTKLDAMIPEDFESSSLTLLGGERVIEDFQNTFKIVYASVIDGPFNFDPQTLTSALCIATAYDYPGLRAFAIQHLEAAALGAVERIRLAREFDISSWEEPAFTELYKRDESITIEEAAVLGLETFVQVARAREQEHRCKCRDPGEHLREDPNNTEVQPGPTHASNTTRPIPIQPSQFYPRKSIIGERLAAIRAKQSARQAQATEDSVNPQPSSNSPDRRKAGTNVESNSSLNW